MDPRSDVLVLFGATGDLARRKLYPALYRMVRRGRLDVPVIGFASSEWDTERLRAYAREGIGHVQLEIDPITRGSIEGFAPVLALLDG